MHARSGASETSFSLSSFNSLFEMQFEHKDLQDLLPRFNSLFEMPAYASAIVTTQAMGFNSLFEMHSRIRRAPLRWQVSILCLRCTSPRWKTPGRPTARSFQFSV